MIIKKPDAKHPGYRLMERQNGRGYVTKAYPEVDAINLDMQEGRLTPDRARQLLEAFRKTLAPKVIIPTWLPENEQIVLDFWEKSARLKPRRSPRAALDRLKWAIKRLGKVSLVGGTREDLHDALSHLNANARRRAVAALNQLIRFKGLNKILMAPEAERLDPIYLTLKEFKATMKKIKRPEYRLCCEAAFATGARYGELFDMWPLSLRSGRTHMWVGTQRLRDWSQERTKNGKMGTAYIIKGLRPATYAWLDVPEDVRRKMRRSGDPYEAFKKAAKDVTKKDVTFHNLRHSYVRHMTENGASLDDLTKWLRDSRATVELYYRGWIQSSDEMNAAAKKFG